MQPSQSQTPAWNNPNESEGYVVDYYAILKLQRISTADEIQAAYRALSRQYHPDLLAQLGDRCPPEFKSIAEKKFGLLSTAYETLSDEARRLAYDKYLAEFKGPVSSDGIPVVSLLGGKFDLLSLTSEGGRQDYERYCALAQTYTGFNPKIHKQLEAVAKIGTTSPEIKVAYEESLSIREAYLSLIQERAFNRLGGVTRSLGVLPELITSAATEAVAAQRAKIEKHAADLLLRAADEKLKLTGDVSQDGELDQKRIELAAQLSEKLFSEIDFVAKQINEIAEERERIITERLNLLELLYSPAGTPPTERLVVLVKNGEDINDTVILPGIIEKIDSEYRFEHIDPPAEEAELKDVTKHQEFSKAGWSIILLNAEGLPLKRAIQTILLKHAEALEAHRNAASK